MLYNAQQNTPAGFLTVSEQVDRTEIKAVMRKLSLSRVKEEAERCKESNQRMNTELIARLEDITEPTA